MMIYGLWRILWRIENGGAYIGEKHLKIIVNFLEKDDSVMRRNNLIDNTYKNDNFSDVIIPHIKRMKDLF